MTNYKPKIIELLEELKKRDISKREIWKARAYDVVIKQLMTRIEPITCIQDIDGMKGVGVKIKQKIEEIIATGDLVQVRNINEEVGIITELSRIFGIGPVRGRELYEKHGIKTIDDLKEHTDLLNEKQLLGLKYYKDFEKRIPRAEMEKHDTLIKQTIHNIDGKFIVEVMGSYRRGNKDSGDIDVLITHPDNPDNHDVLFADIIKELNKMKYLVDTFAQGNKKYNGVSKLKRHRTFRRVDLMYTQLAQHAFALLYFTGSQDFNIKLRSRALEKGYTLNEYGMRYTSGDKKGTFVDQEFKNEEEVFNFLGLSYIEPTKRNTAKLDDYLL